MLKRFKPEDYDLKAAVAMHPCQDPAMNAKHVEIPILYVTGSNDTICSDGCAERFCKNTNTPKVLFNVRDIDHFEPTNLRKVSEKTAVALFFACWVRGEHCDQVYGTSGQEICSHVDAGY